MRQRSVVRPEAGQRDAGGMSRPRISMGVLPDDLYITPEPWPRTGRPPKHDLSAWAVTDDWPERVPVTQAEADAFEAWIGDLFDEMFGTCQ